MSSLSTYVWVLRLAYGWRWRVWSPSRTATMMEEKREGRMWQKQSTLDEVQKSRPIPEKTFLGFKRTFKKRWENGARARISTDLHSELKARRTSGSSETFILLETSACNGKLVHIKYRWSRDWIRWKTCRTRQMRCRRWGARRWARRRRGRSSNPTSPSSPCVNFQFTVACSYEFTAVQSSWNSNNFGLSGVSLFINRGIAMRLMVDPLVDPS